MIEGHSSGYARLQSHKTLREILETAIAFEQAAQDFYARLIPRVGKNLRWLLEELAEEEQRHGELLSALVKRPDLEAQVALRIETPASDTRFSDCIHLADLGEHPDDQAILQYATGREHIAMEQYHALAEATAPGPIQELFGFLANEETRHKAELEKKYYEVVHSGGV